MTTELASAAVAVLLVEDNPMEARLLVEALADAFAGDFRVVHAERLGEAFDRLGRDRFDVVLLDLSLPDSHGLETLARMIARAPGLPVLVLSGLDNDEVALQAVQAGAQDYLVKGQVDCLLLIRAIRYAIERQRVDEALRRAHDELEARVRERTAELEQANRALVVEVAERRQAEGQIRELNEQLEQRLRRIAALRQVDTAIAASLDLRLTLGIILSQVVAQLRVDAAAVLLYDPHSRVLEYTAGTGFRGDEVTRSRLRLGECWAGRVAVERRAVRIPDLAATGGTFTRAALVATEGFVAYHALPLVAKGKVMGVLEIFHRAALAPEPEWHEFLAALAGQAAIAMDQASLFEDLQRSHAELSLAYDATIEGWARALDLRDKETEGHTRRVTEMTVRLARALGLGEAELVHVRRGALLHDIGKMGIPDGILLKPGALTDEEWSIMRRHPDYAYEMLAPIEFLRPALDIPYCHHEKWDGTGYPRGLKGEQIPAAARIFAAVDIWDALKSDRPYRKGLPEDQVRAHIRSLAGAHLDPAVVSAFLAILGEPASDPASGERPAGPAPSRGLFGAAFEAMLRRADDFLLLLDERHRILAAGARFVAAFAPGCDPRGRDFLELLDAGSRDAARAGLGAPADRPHTVAVNVRGAEGDLRAATFTFYRGDDAGARRIIAVGRPLEEAPALVERLARLDRELEQARGDLARQALTDPLTGLGNRRWLFERLDALWSAAGRQGALVWVVAADLDHLQALNEEHGYPAGDAVLVAAAGALRAAVRGEDLVARSGGEEFVLAGTCREASEPAELAIRLLGAIRVLRVEHDDRTLSLTATLGLTVAQPGPSSPPWFALQAASRALSRAKAAGRDRLEAESEVLGRGGLALAVRPAARCRSQAS